MHDTYATAAFAPVLCLRTPKVTWLQCTACDRLQQEQQDLLACCMHSIMHGSYAAATAALRICNACAHPRSLGLSVIAACDRLQQERKELEEERLRQFCTGMKAVNSRLGSVYQQLTAGKGDAYLSYTEDALLLFADGVGFHVRSVTWWYILCLLLGQARCSFPMLG